MNESSERLLFRNLLDRPDAEIDLARAALAIAAEAYPGLEPGPYLERLEGLARAVTTTTSEGLAGLDLLAALVDRLGRVERFHANPHSYDDPRNSYLNEVLDRRTGIPLSLSLVYMLVGQRIGLSMAGIAFPGHFLSRCDFDDGFIVLDASAGGRQLSLSDCESLLRSLQRDASFDRELLEPATHRSIVFRMLANLKGAYLRTRQHDRALSTLDRMLLIAPARPNLLRDRGLLLFQLERFPEAQKSLERYEELAPGRAAADVGAQALLAVARRKRHSVN